MKVALIMGSDSDYDVVKSAIATLKEFGVAVDVRVLSAHRSPNETHEFVLEAEKSGVEVFIACAGKAAHLAGVVASLTAKPVIGLPIKSSFMGGMDSLLSTVQMPSGVPVATVAVNGAVNAAVLAVQILAIKYTELQAKLIDYKQSLADDVDTKNALVQVRLNSEEE